jgi:ADP-ribosylglycohydrolase
VTACFIYLEYLRKLIGGMDKKAAYAELRGDFSGGKSCVDAETLGRFSRTLRSDISSLPESEIKSGGFVIDTLEAAFWYFLTTDNYSDAVLKAVNLGEDADTSAAVAGGLAGLYYGIESIPESWRKKLARYGYFTEISDRAAKNFK